MAHLGIALDAETHDLYLDADGNLAMVTDAQAVGQHMKQRLRTWQPDWFLDATVGLPWRERVFIRPFDQTASEAVIKAAALDTDGVTELTAFTLEQVPASRGINVEIEALTVYDEIVQVSV